MYGFCGGFSEDVFVCMDFVGGSFIELFRVFLFEISVVGVECWVRFGGNWFWSCFFYVAFVRFRRYFF